MPSIPDFSGPVGYFMLLLFIGVGAYIIGDFVNINSRLTGFIGVLGGLFLIYLDYTSG